MVGAGRDVGVEGEHQARRPAATPMPQASPIVRAEATRVSCCAAATGTTISALTSSSPTTRIATVTVSAAVTATSDVEQAHRQARHPGDLLVLAHREQLAAEHGDDRRARRAPAPTMTARSPRADARQRAEQVGHEGRVRAARGQPDEQHAAGDAAVEQQRQRDVAAGPAALADQLDGDGAQRSPTTTRGEHRGACRAATQGDAGERDVADAVAQSGSRRCTR